MQPADTRVRGWLGQVYLRLDAATALRRPIRIRIPASAKRRSPKPAGKGSAGPAGGAFICISSKYARSAVTTTDQVVGVNFGMGAVAATWPTGGAAGEAPGGREAPVGGEVSGGAGGVLRGGRLW